MERGQKRYELSNHLGNVLAVPLAPIPIVGDRKLVHCSNDELMWFEAHCLCRRGGMVSVTVPIMSGYPFGMLPKTTNLRFGSFSSAALAVEIKERSWSVSSYRYGFNGMEKDDDVSGEGNSYTAEFWQYDSRLGRRLSIDPKAKKYPYESPFLAFHNNPMLWTDPKEDDPPYTIKNGELQGEGVKLNITSETFRPKMKSINAIVLHRTVSSTAASAIRTTKNNKGHTGFHVVIDKDGTITQVNNFENKANHVGQQKGTVSNFNSIGIEIVGMPIDKDGNVTTDDKKIVGWQPLTDIQIENTAQLIFTILIEYNLTIDDVFPHEDVSWKTPGEGQVVQDAIFNRLTELLNPPAIKESQATEPILFKNNDGVQPQDNLGGGGDSSDGIGR